MGGSKAGEGNRTGVLGSLLLGYHGADTGELRYAGKVGTGFTGAEVDRLGRLLAERATTEPPFTPPGCPERPVGPPGPVAEVAFAEWTHDNTLRHPSYLGLRTDKEPADVVGEA